MPEIIENKTFDEIQPGRDGVLRAPDRPADLRAWRRHLQRRQRRREPNRRRPPGMVRRDWRPPCSRPWRRRGCPASARWSARSMWMCASPFPAGVVLTSRLTVREKRPDLSVRRARRPVRRRLGRRRRQRRAGGRGAPDQNPQTGAPAHRLDSPAGAMQGACRPC